MNRSSQQALVVTCFILYSKPMKESLLYTIILLTLAGITRAQEFYFGADQSYVNEMEDCGAVYKENGVVKDVYQIFGDHGCNLVRFRLWHTPSWYDNLNAGQRYSDFEDVKKGIQRARNAGMSVLLDFHLSDNWADPGKQVIPAAWLPVADNLPILQDSLYNYIHATLSALDNEGLLPEMVQIGNETNKGILLTPEQNQGWVLDWERNAPLFNSAIQAVRDLSEEIKIMLHIADPKDTGWLMDQFHQHGVTDFDLIGISYYWAWHRPTEIDETGAIIAQLRAKYSDKEVMIVETGYIWTTAAQDGANNITNVVHPDYAPASPENQRDWLIDLTTEVIESGGLGVVYWEPSWVSTGCRTQWGQGSHHENATFFDFSHNLLVPGGIEWMAYSYGLTHTSDPKQNLFIEIIPLPDERAFRLKIDPETELSSLAILISDTSGRVVSRERITGWDSVWHLPAEPGLYLIAVRSPKGMTTKKILAN